MINLTRKIKSHADALHNSTCRDLKPGVHYSIVVLVIKLWTQGLSKRLTEAQKIDKTNKKIKISERSAVP